MSRISKNLKHLRKLKALSQEQLSIELDVSKSRIGSYEESRSEPPIAMLIAFSEFFKVPVDALIKNDLTINEQDSFIDIGNHRVLFPIRTDENDENLVELVTQEASAGYLQGYSDTNYIADLPIMNLPFLPSGKHRAFPIKGDSMHPWVKDGDVVIGEYLENPQLVKNNFCYIILTKDEGLVYKRVNVGKLDQGYLTLISDNKFYQPYQLHMSNILEIWEFKLNLCIGQYQDDELNPSNILNLMRSVGIELKELNHRVAQLENRA